LDEIATCITEVKPMLLQLCQGYLKKMYNKLVMQGRTLPLPMKVLFFWHSGKDINTNWIINEEDYMNSSCGLQTCLFSVNGERPWAEI